MDYLTSYDLMKSGVTFSILISTSRACVACFLFLFLAFKHWCFQEIICVLGTCLYFLNDHIHFMNLSASLC